MIWSVVAQPRDRRVASAVSEALDGASITGPDSWAPTGGPVAVVGSDAVLATIAARLHRVGRRGPVALIPSKNSDLLRMFGLDRTAMDQRIDTGTLARDREPYAVDLGWCRVGNHESPFIAHVVARGRRTADLTVLGDGREATVSGWQVVAANAQHLDGATVAPRAAVMDGLLDIQVFSGSRRVIRRSSRIGLHDRRTGVWRRTRSRAEVDCPPSWSVFADGILIGRGPFQVRLQPGAFDLLI